MPAAMRGAGRSSVKARSKSSATAVKSRPTPAGAGAAGRSPMSFSPRVIFAVSGLAVAGVVAIVLATDHRGARVVQAAGDAFMLELEKHQKAVPPEVVAAAKLQSTAVIAKY